MLRLHVIVTAVRAEENPTVQRLQDTKSTREIAGYFRVFFVADQPSTLVTLYGGIAAGLLCAAALLFVLTRTIQRWSGETA